MTLQVKVTHPSGRVEITTDDAIRAEYAMSLEEYLYFVSTEPAGSAARSRREKERRREVALGTARPFLYSQVWTVDNEWATSASIEFLPNDGALDRDQTTDLPPFQGQRTIGDVKASGIHSRASYNATPLGPELTHEERKRKWQPVGTYPGTLGKGQKGAKTSYFVHGKRTGHGMGLSVIRIPNHADELISGIPSGVDRSVQRLYWEKALLAEYYHLYGENWKEWGTLIPWASPQSIATIARGHGIESQWGSLVKVEVIRSIGITWSPADIDRLIAWYPNRQVNAEEQKVFIAGKSFEEIQAIARKLRLPTRTEIEKLSSQAKVLTTAYG